MIYTYTTIYIHIHYPVLDDVSSSFQTLMLAGRERLSAQVIGNSQEAQLQARPSSSAGPRAAGNHVLRLRVFQRSDIASLQGQRRIVSDFRTVMFRPVAPLIDSLRSSANWGKIVLPTPAHLVHVGNRDLNHGQPFMLLLMTDSADLAQ